MTTLSGWGVEHKPFLTKTSKNTNRYAIYSNARHNKSASNMQRIENADLSGAVG